MEPLEDMGKYRAVVVDPPWPSNGYLRGGVNDLSCSLCRGDRAHKGCPCVLSNGNHQDFDYPLMSISELAALPIPSILDGDALVFLWTINSFVREAFDLLDSWRLEYMCMMYWVKPNGPKPVGYPTYNCEPILVARQGRPKFVATRDFRTANVWDAPRNQDVARGGWGRQIMNCTKPTRFYELLRRVTEPPRLDVFARRRIDGFDSWGNEAPSEDVAVLSENEHKQTVLGI